MRSGLESVGIRRESAVVLAGTLGLLVLVWLTSWWSTGRQLAWPRFYDDAFYYFKVADMAVRGEGWSVDGLHSTNGFHPLWMAVVLPWFALFDGVGEQLAAIQLVLLVVVALGAALLFGGLRVVAGRRIALIGIAALGITRYLSSLLGGLESALAFLTFSALLVGLLRRPGWIRDRARISDAVLGLAVVLVIFSRLDLIFLVPVVAIAIMIARRRASAPVGAVVLKLGATLWPVALLLAPYLAWNLSVDGSIVPISGRIKSSFPAPDLQLQWLRAVPEFFVLLLPAAAGALLAWRDPRLGAARLPLWIGTATISFHAAYTLLFQEWAVFSWYFAAYLPVAVLGGGVVLARIERGVPRAVPLAAGVVLALVVVSQAFSLSRLNPGFRADTENRSFVVAAEEAGKWADSHLPADSWLAMKDSGAFSYFSRRRVSNLDGVIMNLAYQRQLCSGRLQYYLRSIGVDYFVAHHSREAAFEEYRVLTYPIACRLPGGTGSVLKLQATNEIYRGPAYRDGPIRTRLIIWRLTD